MYVDIFEFIENEFSYVQMFDIKCFIPKGLSSQVEIKKHIASSFGIYYVNCLQGIATSLIMRVLACQFINTNCWG